MAYFEGAYEQTTHRLARFDLRFDAIDRELELMSDSLRGEIEPYATSKVIASRGQSV